MNKLTGRSKSLLDLRHLLQNQQVEQIHSLGIQQVPIEQIMGSESRVTDFDEQFRPLKGNSIERWASIAIAHLEDKQLPAIDLIRVDGAYYIRDGHHRTSVAKMIGQLSIDANVVEWSMTEREAPSAEVVAEEKQPISSGEIVGRLLETCHNVFGGVFGGRRKTAQTLLQGS